MSRSYRKVPIVTCSKPGTVKEFKQTTNRKMRRKSATIVEDIKKDIEAADSITFPVIDEAGDKWSGPLDGKGWIRYPVDLDKILRK